MKKSCLCGVSPGRAGRDAALCQGEMPLFVRERCRFLSGRDAAL